MLVYLRHYVHIKGDYSCKSLLIRLIIIFHGSTVPVGLMAPQSWGFEITFRHTTVGRTLLDEWSACRRDLYLTTHNINNIHTSTFPAGFEPAIPVSERPQTRALDRVAIGGIENNLSLQIWLININISKIMLTLNNSSCVISRSPTRHIT